jgi:hypothetical protein
VNDQSRKPPNEKQIRLMGKLLQRAFLEIRYLGREGMAEQAADLADAFHNLPTYMFTQDFSWSFSGDFLRNTKKKYPRPKERSYFDYLTFFDRIEREADDKEWE